MKLRCFAPGTLMNEVELILKNANYKPVNSLQNIPKTCFHPSRKFPKRSFFLAKAEFAYQKSVLGVRWDFYHQFLSSKWRNDWSSKSQDFEIRIMGTPLFNAVADKAASFISSLSV